MGQFGFLVEAIAQQFPEATGRDLVWAVWHRMYLDHGLNVSTHLVAGALDAIGRIDLLVNGNLNETVTG